MALYHFSIDLVSRPFAASFYHVLTARVYTRLAGGYPRAKHQLRLASFRSSVPPARLWRATAMSSQTPTQDSGSPDTWPSPRNKQTGKEL